MVGFLGEADSQSSESGIRNNSFSSPFAQSRPTATSTDHKRNDGGSSSSTHVNLGQQQASSLGGRLRSVISPGWSKQSDKSLRRSISLRPQTKLNRSPFEKQTDEEPMEDPIHDAFYDAQLTIDEASDEEQGSSRRSSLLSRTGYSRPQTPVGGGDRRRESTKLGSDTTGQPPTFFPRDEWGSFSGFTPIKSQKRHRNKRSTRELDQDLDVFNRYAQNGILPYSRSAANQLSDFGGENDQSQNIWSDDAQRRPANRPPDVPAEDRPVAVGDGYDALDIMGDHIFRIGVLKKKWFQAPKMGAGNVAATGVAIRSESGRYRTFPVDHEDLKPFQIAMTTLNPEVGIKIKSVIVDCVMSACISPFPNLTELVIDPNTRIQILDTVELLARARKHQYAAFVRSEQILCVWADDVQMIIPAAELLEEALLQFIWRGETKTSKYSQPIIPAPSEPLTQPSPHGSVSKGKESGILEKSSSSSDIVPTLDEKLSSEVDIEDIERRKNQNYWRERPVMLIAPMSDACSYILVMSLIALGLRTLIKEYILDGNATRFALFLFAPGLFCIASFACMCVIGSFFQIFGPVRQVNEKSRYFSGVAPKRTMDDLPHVTVQLPVYKESLEDVLLPTVESLKKAIITYERQGGSVGVLICDDGLQLLSKTEVDRRRRYYHDNNIAYIARPGHGVDGFIRKGRFKKAGNMNYAAAISLRVEEVMDELRAIRLEKGKGLTELDENDIYEEALRMVLEEKEGKAWAEGNVRFGEIILIIDSDTRVPEDCFADAVSEMRESPEVAIIQHMSGVMQVANHFFENGVAHFTRGIQTAISYCCASGEVAPFVGHNAFLRWSALQECMFVDPDDDVRKIWSEDHVSEDFQIAVTLQIKGYIVRWATYSGGEFEEGVSLTCDDELNRWQKYAFGCSELMFYPVKKWIFKGPITALFHEFIWSCIPLHSKFTICGYIFSYYAIACAWPLSLMNYFVAGFDLTVDDYYLPSWEVNLVCIILFVGLCNVAFITLRYRLKIPDCSKSAFDQIKWIPFFSIFFTGMSMPMSAALASHLVGYDMTWSTTVKTVEKSNFFLQLPIIWRRFWPQLIFFSACVIAMIATSSSLMPSGYRVSNIEVYVPMGILTASHLLYPFALNPWFLSFSF